jgi:hypothetical protein
MGENVEPVIQVDNVESKLSVRGIEVFIKTDRKIFKDSVLLVHKQTIDSLQSYGEIEPGVALEIKKRIPTMESIGASMDRLLTRVEHSVVIRGEIMSSSGVPFEITLPITVYPNHVTREG